MVWSLDETPWISDTFEESVVSVHDDVVLVENDVGGKDEPDVSGYDENPSNNNWLVPNREVDEAKLKKNFDPDTVAASVVPSPLYGIRGLLKMGAAVGAFPADMGERSVAQWGNSMKLFKFLDISILCLSFATPEPGTLCSSSCSGSLEAWLPSFSASSALQVPTFHSYIGFSAIRKCELKLQRFSSFLLRSDCRLNPGSEE